MEHFFGIGMQACSVVSGVARALDLAAPNGSTGWAVLWSLGPDDRHISYDDRGGSFRFFARDEDQRKERVDFLLAVYFMHNAVLFGSAVTGEDALRGWVRHVRTFCRRQRPWRRSGVWAWQRFVRTAVLSG